jgi:CelD/BcsL family acetyltransferase involved in cellulose biosynthesis
MPIALSSKATAAPLERLATEPVDSLAGLQALRSEWQRLWQLSHARPFQSPAWLLPWCRHIGSGRIASVAVRDARGDLAGLAPLYVHVDEQGRRHLFPIGIATTDSLDLLARPGHEEEIAQAVVTHVAAMGGWDVFEAPQLEAGALLLRGRWPPQWSCQAAACEPNPVLSLRTPLPSSLSRKIAYARRRLAQAGRVEYETADAHGAPVLLDALAGLHARRWAQRDLPGVLAAEGVLGWHRECIPALLDCGVLRLLALRFEGNIIAVLYCLADPPRRAHRRWYDYIGGFDPAFAAFSPGTLLLAHAIDEARREGAVEFDFLRGAEAYKYRWGAADRPMFALSVTARPPSHRA